MFVSFRLSLPFHCVTCLPLQPPEGVPPASLRDAATPTTYCLARLANRRRDRSQLKGMEQADTAARTRQERLQVNTITDVNAKRVNHLRALGVKIPGTGEDEELEGTKEAGRVLLREREVSLKYILRVQRVSF